MAEIKKSNGREIIDYMVRDYDSLLRAMREQIPRKLPEWEDYLSEADFGNVLLQLFAHMGDILSYYQDRVANESFLGTAQTRRSIIHHLRLIGYHLSTAAPASTNLTLIVPVDRNETITINKGDAFATKSRKDKPSVHFEYTSEIPLTIDCGMLPRAKKLENGIEREYKLFGKRPNERNWEVSTNPDTGEKYQLLDGVPVEEGFLVRNELLGQSDGSPNQQFTLTHPRLILRSRGQDQIICEGVEPISELENKDIILITELENTITEWTLQESLAFSRENREDFVIQIDDQDQATIVFGDGAFGAVPPLNALIKATYRRGGGLEGNVAANMIETIADAPQLTLLGIKVTNPEPATGGAERESIDHAVLHAPSVFRSFKRAVTTQDYEALARNFQGVDKVRAIANNWNTVTLYIAPEGGGKVSDVLRANLLTYFEDKRPITTLIEIASVDYVDVYVTAIIGVQRFYDVDEVKAQVQEAAGSLLAFDNVDFKQIIYLSKFYEAIEAVEGVAYVTITEFSREHPPSMVEPEGKITMGDNEIAIPPADSSYVGGINVQLAEEQG